MLDTRLSLKETFVNTLFGITELIACVTVILKKFVPPSSVWSRLLILLSVTIFMLNFRCEHAISPECSQTHACSVSMPTQKNSLLKSLACQSPAPLATFLTRLSQEQQEEGSHFLGVRDLSVSMCVTN